MLESGALSDLLHIGITPGQIQSTLHFNSTDAPTVTLITSGSTKSLKVGSVLLL